MDNVIDCSARPPHQGCRSTADLSDPPTASSHGAGSHQDEEVEWLCLMGTDPLSPAASVHLRQAPCAGKPLSQPSRADSNHRQGHLSAGAGLPLRNNIIGLGNVSLVACRAAVLLISTEATPLSADDLNRWLPAFWGRLHLSSTLPSPLAEEIHRTLEPWAPAGCAPSHDLRVGFADLEASQPLEPSHRQDRTPSGERILEDDLRITYGTDRLRAGAGACELVCSQAMLFEIGCLLLSHAKRSLARKASSR